MHLMQITPRQIKVASIYKLAGKVMIGFAREMKHFPCKAGHDEVALWKGPEARAFTYKWGGPASAGRNPFMP